VEGQLCRLCTTVLRASHDPRDPLCAACRSKMRHLDGESLALVIDGILRIELGLHGPGGAQRLHLQRHLQEFHIEASCHEVLDAVKKVRRRRTGLVVEGAKWQIGYRPAKVQIWRRPRAVKINRRGRSSPLPTSATNAYAVCGPKS
jgi:hypothetical protein